MMKKTIIVLFFALLLCHSAIALKASTTPLQDEIYYVDSNTRYFYIYITNDKEEYDFVKIHMEPNSDYKFADSEFAFLYEQELHPGQIVKIPIYINNMNTEFVLSYDIKSNDFATHDSFLVMPQSASVKKNATIYTLILAMFALATMMVLYIWNRFVYHSYKIDYQKHKNKKKREKIYQEPSSAKL